jgi:very-short-patch-repair endonuclease
MPELRDVWLHRPRRLRNLGFAEWLQVDSGVVGGTPKAPDAPCPPLQPRSKAPKKKSKGEETLTLHLRANGVEFVREYEFAVPRKYRADFFILPNLLIEVEGGTWSGGRHTRPSGYTDDCAKYNLATLLGFAVLRYTTQMVERGVAIRDIMGLLP